MKESVDKHEIRMLRQKLPNLPFLFLKDIDKFYRNKSFIFLLLIMKFFGNVSKAKLFTRIHNLQQLET